MHKLFDGNRIKINGNLTGRPAGRLAVRCAKHTPREHILYAIFLAVIFFLCVCKNHGLFTLFFMDATVTERCLSNTAGQIDVGGRIRLANWPRLHSALMDAAHRLCNCQWNIYDLFFPFLLFIHFSFKAVVASYRKEIMKFEYTSRQYWTR